MNFQIFVQEYKKYEYAPRRAVFLPKQCESKHLTLGGHNAETYKYISEDLCIKRFNLKCSDSVVAYHTLYHIFITCQEHFFCTMRNIQLGSAKRMNEQRSAGERRLSIKFLSGGSNFACNATYTHALIIKSTHTCQNNTRLGSLLDIHFSFLFGQFGNDNDDRHVTHHHVLLSWQLSISLSIFSKQLTFRRRIVNFALT